VDDRRPPEQVAPSGRQVSLVFGDQEAVVTEVGGGLRDYRVAGRPVLDGYGVDERCTDGRGQLLIPWPNRLKGGRYQFGGDEHQLPLTEPERSNAIHGLVRWANWDVVPSDDHTASARLVLHPQPGYPFTLGLEIRYALSPGGLSVTLSAINLGSRPLPYGAGCHPYLTVGTALVNEAILHIPALSILETDDCGIPTGPSQPVAGSAHDFTEPQPVEDRVVDDCFTGLTRDRAGVASVTLTNPVDGNAVVVWMDPSFEWVMVFTGDTLNPDKRRRGIAIEPMTCPPDAFRSGTDLVVLDPGQQHVAGWGISPSRRAAGS
jgi:galactose mutarotase-like enzyme